MAVPPREEGGETDAAAVARRYVEGYLDTGDEAVGRELLAENVLTHQLGVGVDRVGREAILTQMAGFRNAVPDWSLRVEDVVAEDDRVMLRVRTTGRPRRAWGRLVPTGRSFEVAGFFAFRVEDARIVEQWTLVNLAGIGRQLGLMPPTPRGFLAVVRHRLLGRVA